MLSFLSNAKKAVVTAIGIALTLLTDAQAFSAFIPSSASTWIATAIAVLTPIVTYLVPNGPAAPATPPAA
jgi:hypothetical protein